MTPMDPRCPSPTNSNRSSPLNFESDIEEEIDIQSEIEAIFQSIIPDIQTASSALAETVLKATDPLHQKGEDLKKRAEEMKVADVLAEQKETLKNLKQIEAVFSSTQNEQEASLKQAASFYEKRIANIQKLNQEILPRLQREIEKSQNDPLTPFLYTMAQQGATNMACKGERKHHAAGKSYYNIEPEQSWHIRNAANSAKEMIEQIDQEVKKHVRNK